MPRKILPPRLCFSCPTEIKAPYNLQKYCAPCAQKINWARKNEWGRKHQKETWAKRKDVVAGQLTQRRKILSDAGAAESIKSAKNILWDSNQRPDLVNVVKMKVPFTWALSKNYQWSYRRQGYVYLRTEAKAARECIIQSLKMKDHGFVQGKVWVDICVQKTEHKGDAVNFVDAICDAVKKGIGIDDRWFSLGLVDWQIVKKDPFIIISIGQEYTEPHQVCCYCGAIKHRDQFMGKKTIGRECRACLKLLKDAKKGATS